MHIPLKQHHFKVHRKDMHKTAFSPIVSPTNKGRCVQTRRLRFYVLNSKQCNQSEFDDEVVITLLVSKKCLVLRRSAENVTKTVAQLRALMLYNIVCSPSIQIRCKLVPCIQTTLSHFSSGLTEEMNSSSFGSVLLI